MRFPKKIEVDYAYLEIQEQYIISTIKEGIVFDSLQLENLFKIFDTYYKGKPFVSIAIREYDYNINPTLLQEKSHPNLIGIGIVCSNASSRDTALFEKKFYKGSFEVFDSLDKCLEWSNKLFKNYKKADL